MRRTPLPPPVARTALRCAIYCRKSSEEGLGQDFNSLDAQRESGEAYIASQKSEGWKCIPTRYDDGGFSGGSLDRPALKRLIADIEAGRVDAVIVYKIDRISRSLMDFAHLTELFEKHDVKLVSTTQHFSTATSMGRLTLNMMLSFAQFEREIIGERIRDKLGAARRRGMWTGGKPLLGYDVDRSGGSPKLKVNAAEAERVLVIFGMYLELGSLLPVVVELMKRGWSNKSWTTRAGRAMGGRPFDRQTLHALLINPIFAGQTVHLGVRYPGEHEPIVPLELYERVQTVMSANGRARRIDRRSDDDPLLRGILKCGHCQCSMVHVLWGKGERRNRSYVCSKSNKTSRAYCPTGSLRAPDIERAVVEQLADVGLDQSLLRDTIREAIALDGGAPGDVRLAEEVKTAFGDFNGLWRSLTPQERRRAMTLLVERVEYEHGDSSIEITFREAGVRSLAVRKPEHIT